MVTELARLSRRIVLARAVRDGRRGLGGQLNVARKQRDALQRRLGLLERRCRSEQLDVRRLAGLSATALLARLSQDREQRLEKERREALLAALRLVTCRRQLAETRTAVRALERRRAALSDAEERYERSLAGKIGWMKRQSSRELTAVMELSQREGALKDFRRELDEAISAGNAALSCLEHAASGRDGLRTLPMSVGPLPRFQRDTRLDHAHRNAADAQRKLARFRRELEDVRGRDTVSVNLRWSYPRLPDLLTMGIGETMLDQVRIQESYQFADASADRLRTVLRQLSRERERVEKVLEQVQRRRERIILACAE